MMTLGELQSLCALCSFGDAADPEWTLKCGGGPSSFWIQWVFMAQDSQGFGWGAQHGRKWQISQHSIPDEVVKTAFAAVLFALEHEARERFRYKEQPIFHPHTDVEALVEVQQAGRLVTRKEKTGGDTAL